MYNTLRIKYYWSHMAKDVYSTVRDCTKCVQNRLIKKELQLFRYFLQSGPLELVAMNNVRPISKTFNCHKFVLVVTDSYSKSTRAILLLKITCLISSLFLLITAVYDMMYRSNCSADTRCSLSVKSWIRSVIFLGTKSLTTTRYNPQTIGQQE